MSTRRIFVVFGGVILPVFEMPRRTSRNFAFQSRSPLKAGQLARAQAGMNRAKEQRIALGCVLARRLQENRYLLGRERLNLLMSDFGLLEKSTQLCRRVFEDDLILDRMVED